MTVKEAASRLGLSVPEVYQIIARGELAHYRYGRRIVLKPADLAAFEERHRVESRPSGSKPSVRSRQLVPGDRLDEILPALARRRTCDAHNDLLAQ